MSYEDCSNILKFYSRRYPMLRSVLAEITTVFNSYTEEDTEIELRLGTIIGGRFVNGVSPQFLYQAEILLDQYNGWSPGETRWLQSVDYFFTDGGNRFRTRVDFMDSVETPATIQKKVVRRIDMLVLDDVAAPVAVDLAPGAVRLQVSREISADLISCVSVAVDLVRIKQTRSFRYGELWRYDLSKVWVGKTFNEADRLLLSGAAPSVCELELEFTGNLKKNSPCATRNAVSVLLKCLDFFPPGSCFCQI